MQNRVGDNVPTAAKLQSLLKQLNDVIAELRKFGITLTKAERKRLLRARRDSEPMQRLVYELAKKKGLSLAGFPLDGMLSDVNLVQALEPFVTAMTTGWQLTNDTALQADTEGWQAFLAYYGVLSSMADHDAELATQLQPVVDFMKVGRRKPEPEPGPEPTP
jgi:hypothetical protein